jgi:hypothetical protein
MPYNFEATFVQPLLAQLDNGLMKGSEDWANAITKAYITTIKTGLPQGPPPTLPAPGLNPTAPPPYPLGVSGFSTADTRSKQMYTIIHAYFYAKELKLEKGSIQVLVQNVKHLIQRLKTRTNQVKSLIEQANNIRKELSRLPQTIKEILQDLKDEIKQRFNDLKQAIDALMDIKINIGEVDFNNVFAQELEIIDTLKNFNLTNIQGVRKLALFLSQYGRDISIGIGNDDRISIFKKYLRDKLKAIATEFIELSKGAIDPTVILSFMSQLASDRARLQKVLAKIKRLDILNRLLKPKLDILEEKKDAKVKEIKENIQKRIVELQNKIQERIDNYIAKKKDSVAFLIYKKASKTIKAYEKRYADKAKVVRKKITTYKGLAEDAANIFKKSVAIVDGVAREFDTIKLEIERFKQLPKDYSNFVSQAQALTQISTPELSPKDLKNELTKLRQYFNNMGISQFGNLGALVMTQVNCDLATFKTFFKRKRSTITTLVDSLAAIESDIRSLVNKIRSLRDESKRSVAEGTVRKKLDTNKSAVKSFYSKRVKSLEDALVWYKTKIEPKIEPITYEIESEKKRLTDKLVKEIKKGKEDLKIFALNLVPLKSDIEDKKNKKATAKAKELALKTKVKQIKDIIEKLKFVSKAVKGGVSLVSSVLRGNYKFSENQQYIDQMLDGVYGYKKKQVPKLPDGSDDTVAIAALDEQRLKIADHFKSLLIIEVLAYGLIETIKDINETDFKKEFESILNELVDNVQAKVTLEKIKNLADNPYIDPKRISEIAQDLGSGILEDQSVITRLLGLERKYLRKSRQIVRSLCDIKELDNSKFRVVLDSIKKTLDKDQSFIVLGMKYLGTELRKFKVFIQEQLEEFLGPIQKKLKEKIKRIKELAQIKLDRINDRLVNLEAPIMTFTYAFAARSFWTGAQWKGPTGTNHIALNLGAFTPMKAIPADGPSAMIREIARGFEAQLMQLQGLVIPPANTGIVPIPFNGYK